MTTINKTSTTIYSLAVDIIKKTGGTIYKPLLNTTLNEKYNIVNNIQDYGVPSLGYYGVGLPEVVINDASELGLYKNRHSSTSTDLFNPVPFLARDVNIGLTPEEEIMYKIKVYKTIGSKTYILCYLKKIDYIDPEPVIFKQDLNNDKNYTASKYDPISDVILTPTNNDSKTFIGLSSNITLELSALEILNIKTAVNLLYPELSNTLAGNYIAELALYHGLEFESELYKTQAAYFIENHFSLNDTSFKYVFNLGGVAPMVIG